MARPQISQEIVKKGMDLINAGISIRNAAREVGISDATLRRRLKGNLEVQPPQIEKVRELRFIRNYDFKLIPRYLFEQVKAVNWNLDRLYEYGHSIALNPCTLLYVMADKDYKIKGFMWATINPLREMLAINTLSVDKEYQNRGEPLRYAMEICKKIQTQLGLKGLECSTTRPRAFERIGGKRSKHIIMEMKRED